MIFIKIKNKFHFRQTVLISEERRAECDALFALYCANFAGFIKLLTSSEGLLDNVCFHVSLCFLCAEID